jgi:predicted Na+-dependent transporter
MALRRAPSYFRWPVDAIMWKSPAPCKNHDFLHKRDHGPLLRWSGLFFEQATTRRWRAAMCRRDAQRARSILGIVVQLLLPFVAGQLLPPWIGAYLTHHSRALTSVDYGSILILVYSAFSHRVVDGIWYQRSVPHICSTSRSWNRAAGGFDGHPDLCRQLGFPLADEIAIVFCGSKKSLVNGVPIASLLFAEHVGLVVIPLMLFHQLQLMVCASLARHYAIALASVPRGFA